MQRRGRRLVSRSGQSAGAATSPADATGADRVSDGQLVSVIQVPTLCWNGAESECSRSLRIQWTGKGL